MARIAIPEGCKSYATPERADLEAGKRLPPTVRYIVVAQMNHDRNPGLRFYPVVVLDAATAREFGVLFPFYTTGSAG